jgi:alpha-tubulin suppressor-like RCC1 family protein
MRGLALAASMLIALAIGGCARHLTELVVVVDTDLRIPQDIDSVDIDVTGPSMGQPSHAHAALQGAGAVNMPVSLSLVPASTDRLTPVTIVVSGRLGATTVVTRTVRTAFVLDQRRSVPVLLLRSCVGTTCDAGLTCIGTSCGSANVDAASLPAFSGTVSPLDGGRRDACVPQTETCNGMDDDCDGMVDEGFDLQTDTANCGRCGNACMLDHTATPVCAAGTCRPMTCASGFGDCDGMPANGCEQSLDTLSHCGACGTACTRANAAASCAGHACHIEVCNAGFADCDGVDGNGCEVALDQLDHCGTCAATCARDHATATCTTRTCAIASCAPGFGDCDGDDATGCESPLDTPLHCHACGTDCSYPNAAAQCTGTGCALGACAAGFGNCDANDATGCETDVLTNAANCGRCGHACAMSACNGGVCDNERIAEISAGQQFTCARRQLSGEMFCWGANDSGQLGDGTFSMRTLPTPVVSVTAADAIATGDSHTCIHRGGATGSVQCWGDNTLGQLGNGSAVSSSTTPVTATGLASATQLAAGSTHTCARLSSGAVRCWGGNIAGQLGDGTLADRRTAVAVVGISTAAMVAAGQAHSCAVLTNGSVMCWGTNGSGQLGDGTNTDHATPSSVMGVFNAISIVAGDNHTCALLSTGGVMCWGFNATGQLGDGTTTTRNVPVAVSGLGDAVEIAAGQSHTCARRATGSVVCWGYDFNGQLGDGTTTNRNVPVAVSGLTNVAMLTAGGSFTCASSTASVISCWGANSAGQLGTGTTSTSQLTPAAVMNLP